MDSRSRALIALATAPGLLFTAACAATADAGGGSAPAVLEAAPVALDASIQTQWEYLQSRYDGNGDGRVTPDEYTREGHSLDRWDRDKDGLLSAADFEGGGGGGFSRADMIQSMREPLARRMMSRYFQEDEDDAIVAPSELERAIADYDANDDHVLDPDEFRARAESVKVAAPGDDSPMIQHFMRGMDPWDTIAAAVDADASGTMSASELDAFYAKMAEGANEWDLVAMTGGGGGSGDDTAPMTGPAVGTMAPDFTLEPRDGTEAVSLSSFRGEKPVALIFGSYT